MILWLILEEFFEHSRIGGILIFKKNCAHMCVYVFVCAAGLVRPHKGGKIKNMILQSPSLKCLGCSWTFRHNLKLWKTTERIESMGEKYAAQRKAI